MSSSRVMPDASKWKTAPKPPPQQRQLVDSRFRAHCGISTPPSTGRHKFASSSQQPTPSAGKTTRKRQAVAVTPTAPSRGIESYLTPPTTGPTELKTKRSTANLISNIPREQCGSSQPASALAPHIGPSQSTRMVSTPSALQPACSPEPIPELSLRALTPLPDAVLATHKRLCGQDSARRAAAASPWRRVVGADGTAQLGEIQTDGHDAGRVEERQRKRLRLDIRDNLNLEAVDRVHGARQRRALGQFKSLAHVSSSDDRSSSPRYSPPRASSPSEGRVSALAPRHPNAVPLRRCATSLEKPGSKHHPGWVHTSSRQPALKLRDVGQEQLVLRSASSPAKVESDARGRSVTPRKRQSEHHHVTPPKSRTPRRYAEQHETLFDLPPPPAAPRFTRVSPARRTEWRPVDMEPETLLTWSLGGPSLAVPNASLRGEEIVDDDTQSLAPSVPSQDFPHLFDDSPNGKGRPRSTINTGFVESPSPSPARSSRSTRDSGGEIVSPLGRGPSWPIGRAADGDCTVSHALSSTEPVSACRSAPSPVLQASGTRRTMGAGLRQPRARPGRRSGLESQTRLDQFGYFHSAGASSGCDFAAPFENDEDLDFGEDPISPLTPRGRRDSRLCPIPDPPPHPSLRPAGVRAMARQEEAERVLYPVQVGVCSPPSAARLPSTLDIARSTDFTDLSSSSGIYDAPRISASTRAWWDGLGGRSDSPLEDLPADPAEDGLFEM